MEIREIGHGIACRIGDKIFIHRKLRGYPELYKKIIEHEKAHSSGLTKEDIKMDLHNKHLEGVKGDYYRFIISNPSSWTEYLPFGIYDGKFVLNPLLIGFWSIALVSLAFIWRWIN